MKPEQTGRGAVFSPSRFMRLLRAEARARWRVLGAFMLVLTVVGVLLAGMLLAVSQGQALQTEVQSVIYVLGLLLSGYVFAHVWFAPLQRSPSALLALMLPASVAEKWWLSALALGLLYPLAYTLAFVLVFGPASALGYAWQTAQLAEQIASLKPGANGAAPPGGTLALPQAVQYAVFLPGLRAGQPSGAMGWAAQLAWLSVYATVIGYAATLLVWFRRAAAIKALALGVALLLTFLLSLSLVGAGWDRIGWWLNPDRHVASLRLGVLAVLFWVGVPLLLWLTSLLALRERDLA